MNIISKLEIFFTIYPVRELMRRYLVPYDFASTLIALNLEPYEIERRNYLNTFWAVLNRSAFSKFTWHCAPKMYLMGKDLVLLKDHIDCTLTHKKKPDAYRMTLHLYCNHGVVKELVFMYVPALSHTCIYSSPLIVSVDLSGSTLQPYIRTRMNASDLTSCDIYNYLSDIYDSNELQLHNNSDDTSKDLTCFENHVVSSNLPLWMNCNTFEYTDQYYLFNSYCDPNSIVTFRTDDNRLVIPYITNFNSSSLMYADETDTNGFISTDMDVLHVSYHIDIEGNIHMKVFKFVVS